MKLYSKHPDAKLDYSVDWSDFIAADDEITESTWTIEEITDDANPVSGSGEGISGDVSVIWLEGGTLGFYYLISNAIVTDDGREDTRSFILKIETT